MADVDFVFRFTYELFPNPSAKRLSDCWSNSVEPLNKGHLGTQAAVPYSEVVPYWEVRDKTVILQHE